MGSVIAQGKAARAAEAAKLEASIAESKKFLSDWDRAWLKRQEACLAALKSGPTVGMGATYGIGSDRYACTVVEVSASGHRVVVTDDDYRPTKATRERTVITDEAPEGGLYVPRPDGERHVFTLRADGRYRSAGRRCGTLTLGIRETYRDPSF